MILASLSDDENIRKSVLWSMVEKIKLEDDWEPEKEVKIVNPILKIKDNVSKLMKAQNIKFSNVFARLQKEEKKPVKDPSIEKNLT